MKPFEFQDGDKVRVRSEHRCPVITYQGVEIGWDAEYIVQGGGIVEGRDYNTLFPIGGGAVAVYPADKLESVSPI